jgi:hypothetical protein
MNNEGETDISKKEWVSVESLIKELNKYHGGLHPTCNICRLIRELEGEE